MTTMAGPTRGGARPSIALDFPQSLGVFDKYEDAQRTVDYLSDQQFAVQNVMIVGTDLRQVERITGRLTYARAAMAGAASGAWFGLLIGILLSLFSTGNDAWTAILTG